MTSFDKMQTDNGAKKKKKNERKEKWFQKWPRQNQGDNSRNIIIKSTNTMFGWKEKKEKKKRRQGKRMVTLPLVWIIKGGKRKGWEVILFVGER